MGADGGRVEDQDVQVRVPQRRQDRVPPPLGGPPVEPPPLAVPVPEPLGQVGPRDAGPGHVQDGVEEQTVIGGHPPGVPWAAGEQVVDAGDVAGFRHGNCEFLLQNFYTEEFAGNFMMQLLVEDLDAWWAHIESLDVAGQFGVPQPRAPALMPWGLREIHLIGPSGELWHIAQA